MGHRQEHRDIFKHDGSLDNSLRTSNYEEAHTGVDTLTTSDSYVNPLQCSPPSTCRNTPSFILPPVARQVRCTACFGVSFIES